MYFISDRSIQPRCTFATRRYGNALRTLQRDNVTGPLVTPPFKSEICASVAHTHPSGSSGNAYVSGVGGTLYLPRRFSWASQSGAAFRLDALQEDVGGFVVAALGAGKVRLGGDQPAFAGVLEDAGPVPFQIGLDPLQRGNG